MLGVAATGQCVVVLRSKNNSQTTLSAVRERMSVDVLRAATSPASFEAAVALRRAPQVPPAVLRWGELLAPTSDMGELRRAIPRRRA